MEIKWIAAWPELGNPLQVCNRTLSPVETQFDRAPIGILNSSCPLNVVFLKLSALMQCVWRPLYVQFNYSLEPLPDGNNILVALYIISFSMIRNGRPTIVRSADVTMAPLCVH